MVNKEIILEHPERFEGACSISKAKLDGAIEKALDKLEKNIPNWTDSFARTCSVDYKYVPGANDNWECGMQTGAYWLAYELSGNPKYREVAEKHLLTYKERFEQKVSMNNHDIGFVFAPSCVAAYKLTGCESIRRLALDVAEYYYNTLERTLLPFIITSLKWALISLCMA